MSQHPAPEGAGADKAPAITLAALNSWLASQRDPAWLRSDAVREFVASQPSLGFGGNATGSILRDARGFTAAQQAQRGTSALRAVVAFTDDKHVSGSEAACILACNAASGPGVPACTALGQRMLDAALLAEDLVRDGHLALRWNAPGTSVVHVPPFEDGGELITGADLFDAIRGLVWLPGEAHPCPVHAAWECPYGVHREDGSIGW